MNEQLQKLQPIVDILHKLSMIILVILLIGAMWQMNTLMNKLIEELHKSYLSLDTIKVLIDKSWWF